MKLSKKEFVEKTCKLANKAYLELNENQLNKLYEYKEMLIEWNEKFNLTSIVDDDEIIVKHIIDSLETVKYIKEGQKLIDVGTGAGLPGIIISIYFEGNVNVTLFDALNKRILFLNEVIERLELKNTKAVHGRAEETSRWSDFREKYDVVISRAVAVLNVLLELTVPFVKPNGICLYMKSGKIEEEIKAAKNAQNELGVKYFNTVNYELRLNDEIINHSIVSYIKEKNISDKYPRQFAKIKKNPL